jgi:hypothetical protein
MYIFIFFLLTLYVTYGYNPVAKFDGATVCVHDVSGLGERGGKKCFPLKKGERAYKYMPGFGTITFNEDEFE